MFLSINDVVDFNEESLERVTSNMLGNIDKSSYKTEISTYLKSYILLHNHIFLNQHNIEDIADYFSKNSDLGLSELIIRESGANKLNQLLGYSIEEVDGETTIITYDNAKSINNLILNYVKEENLVTIERKSDSNIDNYVVNKLSDYVKIIKTIDSSLSKIDINTIIDFTYVYVGIVDNNIKVVKYTNDEVAEYISDNDNLDFLNYINLVINSNNGLIIKELSNIIGESYVINNLNDLNKLKTEINRNNIKYFGLDTIKQIVSFKERQNFNHSSVELNSIINRCKTQLRETPYFTKLIMYVNDCK